MKHPRFYTALPRVGRVRSNSASRALYTNPTTLPLASFFDTPPPPPPNTRLTTHRLPIEARGEVEAPNTNPHPTHAPLALAAPHSPTHQSSHPAQLALLFPYNPGPTPKPSSAPASNGGRSHRRGGKRYMLDVGAYGIPKRGHRVRAMHTNAYQESYTDAPLAVQVGEDAYFVRENAMGVADGVGGWARVKHPAPPSGPSASALFARRLMHFCADEVDRASHPSLHSQSTPPAVPVVKPWSAYNNRFAPYPASAAIYSDPGLSSLPTSWKPPESWRSPTTEFAPSSSSFDAAEEYDADDAPEWEGESLSPADALAAELDELADGLDVLHILERAYERTLHAHVVPAPSSSSTSLPQSLSSTAAPSSLPTKMPMASSSSLLMAREEPKTIPLLAGSSTALVAVLDYVPAGEVDATIVGGPSSSTPSSSATTSSETNLDARAGDAELTPVLKIAHVGDCVGMLVRGEEVAWRSEEMWWRWNTPVQLSAAPASSSKAPVPPTEETKASKEGWWRSVASASEKERKVEVEVTPSSAAHLFTLPVKAGDIVILASDGLSDNLWDEEVLEEVRRVRGVVGSSELLETSDEVFDIDVEGSEAAGKKGVDTARLRRQTLAGMLSEALCSRARRVATRKAGKERWRGCSGAAISSSLPGSASASGSASTSVSTPSTSVASGSTAASSLPTLLEEPWTEEDDTPFARRARESGRAYRGGKSDDISVIVAVIAPAEEQQRGHGRGRGRGRGVEAARAAGS
ncbi:protein phosphatase [Favolaschia claudopus]|uniref:Protein phosphatase n=1 Tax=Favolaschia claudopus TaxID=2862362 RepID=A0AAW0BXB2_9AGAR